jgi:uncharacterized protein YuzE
MLIRYDSEVDALSILFTKTSVNTVNLSDDIAADYDSNGKLVGIEILDATKNLAVSNIFDHVLIEGLGNSVIKKES